MGPRQFNVCGHVLGIGLNGFPELHDSLGILLFIDQPPPSGYIARNCLSKNIAKPGKKPAENREMNPSWLFFHPCKQVLPYW